MSAPSPAVPLPPPLHSLTLFPPPFPPPPFSSFSLMLQMIRIQADEAIYLKINRQNPGP